MTNSKAILMSKWITNNKDFIKTENIFSMNNTKTSDLNRFELKYKLVYQGSQNLISTTLKDISLKHEKINLNIPLADLHTPTSPFRIAFEISYRSEVKTGEEPLELKFYSFSFGDPCKKTNGSVCKEGDCNPIAPQDYNCACKTKGFGLDCDNSNICNQAVSSYFQY
jgi:hypothetical protein